MELLWYGNTVQDKDWEVCEDHGCGFVRIYKITSGNLTYMDENMVNPLQNGNIYLFPSSVPYRILCDENTTFACTWLHVSSISFILQKLICIPSENNQLCHQIFDLLQTLISVENPETDLVQLCTRMFVSQCINQDLLQTVDCEFLNIATDLQQHATQNIEISQIAQKYGYSTEHFIRLFKKQLNLTPYQFLTNIRMGIARDYLREGRRVNEVALLTGYSDVKVFNNAFKKKHAITATQYKKDSARFI